MTRDEVIAALEERLGRGLTKLETRFVDAALNVRTLAGSTVGQVTPDFVDALATQVDEGVTEDQVDELTERADPLPEDRQATADADPDTGGPPDSAPEPPQPPFEPPRPSIGGFNIGVNTDPTSPGAAAAQIPPDLERRFRQAATDAGMAPAQIDAELVSMAPMFTDPSLASQAETLLEGRIADLEQSKPAGPAPIGVPGDFVAQRDVGGFPGSPTQGPTPGSTLDVDPRYFDGDEWSPAGQSPEEIARIQSRLEAAGLLNPDSYWAGTWDDQTIAAYRSALGMANASGRSVDAQIARLVATLPESVKEQRRRAEASETFQAPPYMRPDPDALAQRVKDEIRSALGREPTPEDLAWGIQGLGADFRAQYEAQVAAARAEFDAGVAIDPGAGGGTFQSVDPVSSFRDRLEQRFGPEIDRLAALPEVRENMNNIFGSMRTMESLIR